MGKPDDIEQRDWDAACVLIPPSPVDQLIPAFDELRVRIARAIATARDEGRAEQLERDAIKAKDWLEGWGRDLYETFESYVEAQTSGTHNGRRINKDDARLYAGNFRERAEAVYACGDQLAAAIRKGEP